MRNIFTRAIFYIIGGAIPLLISYFTGENVTIEEVILTGLAVSWIASGDEK